MSAARPTSLLAKTSLLLIAAACPLGPGGVFSVHGQNVAKLYRDNCASCHGTDYAGGSAPSMLDDTWLTDGSDRALYDAIFDGLEDAGMPAYRGGLSESESWSLVVYLREARDRVRREKLGPSTPDDQGVYTTAYHRYRVEPVAKGLDRPWAIDFLPDGAMLVTERPGRLRLIEAGELSRPVVGTPKVWAYGQGGMLDVAVDPDYADNGWVYLSFSQKLGKDDAGKRDRGMTAVVRGRIDRDRLRFVDQQTLFTTPPKLASRARVHFGSRFVFGDDDTLFFAVGDRGQQGRAQELDKPNGKIHRIHRDGSVPADNPFAKEPGALATVWSLGHRNPQGLSRHPETGALYDVEHGPRGGDEINLVERAKNYGWPVVSYSMNYNQTPRGDNPPFHADKGFVDPVHYWLPSVAICGSSFYTGERFARWKNDLFVAALAKQEIRRVRLGPDGRSVVEDEPIFRGLGRVRDVVTGPDGLIYVATEQPGLIRRLVPVE